MGEFCVFCLSLFHWAVFKVPPSTWLPVGSICESIDSSVRCLILSSH